MKGTIWLVEDDEHLNIINGRKLRKQGYQVLTAETLEEARALLEGPLPDLILLDIMLPDGNGLDFCDIVRERGDIPVLFLTARDESEEIVQGLARGGDDYLTKPYDLEVLSARVEALLRRSRRAGPILRLGGLELDLVAAQAFLDGEDMLLSGKEFAALLLLVRNVGQVLEKEDIYRKVWGQPMAENSRALYTTMSRLNKKLEPCGDRYRLKAVRNGGYRLDIS